MRVTKAELETVIDTLNSRIEELLIENSHLRQEISLLQRYNPSWQVITASMATNGVLRELIRNGRLK